LHCSSKVSPQIPPHLSSHTLHFSITSLAESVLDSRQSLLAHSHEGFSLVDHFLLADQTHCCIRSGRRLRTCLVLVLLSARCCQYHSCHRSHMSRFRSEQAMYLLRIPPPHQPKRHDRHIPVAEGGHERSGQNRTFSTVEHILWCFSCLFVAGTSDHRRQSHRAVQRKACLPGRLRPERRTRDVPAYAYLDAIEHSQACNSVRDWQGQHEVGRC
jgi:hypothetical protein